ncbi:Swt1 family HEPN domain-containing protein [Brachybacterium squillarum]|uniref:Swt1 family HEPN domain-containing protein n=1 Tax=Brachybacterium squillarum TaxID=661979 RepID=UPI002221A3F5|nr:Swt1 family HEPN domain-containing protein [Brachybacterium squillarum]MCW1804358.1 Swt1 family HEPN domain-containing protein [Brachybacterium squillarum]
MTTTPRQTVLAATDHLASRLDGVIARVLEPDLNGLDWTTVLLELDKLKGRRPSLISRNDLQAQLRMLTERLGALGFPFDDDSRTVSTVASDLRTVRRNLAHTNPFSTLEAWRAADLCVRLLEALGDNDGIIRATELRHEAFLGYAEESGLGPAPALPETARTLVPGERHAEDVLPDAESGRRSVEDTVRGSDGRAVFEEWQGRQVGDVAVLDTITRKDSKLKVQALAEEIVDVEWPVSLVRLSKLVGRGFGLAKVVSARQRRIERQIRNADLFVDDHGFVWPSAVEAADWSEFRTEPEVRVRAIEEISPQEIANALAWIRSESPSLSAEGQELEVLKVFGRERKTQGVRRQLDLAWELL